MPEIIPEKHRCSPCGNEFANEAEYLSHECEKAGGAKPGTVQYLKNTTQPNYDKISAAAQERGQQQ